MGAPIDSSTWMSLMNCLIVSSHTLTILGFKSLLEEIFAAMTLTTVTSLDQGIERIANGMLSAFELVLVDLPDLQTETESLRRLRFVTPPPATIAVVSYCNSPSLTATYRRHGANIVVSKCWTPSAIATALTDAIGACRDARVPTDRPREAARQSPSLPPLTARQHDVVALLLAGCSNKHIASSLNLSYGTVKNYMFDLMRLLSVRSRLELVAKIREGNTPSVATATQPDPPRLRLEPSPQNLAAQSAAIEAKATTAAMSRAAASTLSMST